MTSSIDVDVDLLRRYGQPVPRYTSYPTALHFGPLGPGFDAHQARYDKDPDRGISLYVHLPFCRSLCWYCGCTMQVSRDQSVSSAYLDTLEREMDQVAARLHPDRVVHQIHLGGGTPTFLLPDELRRLGRMIRARFCTADDVEAGVEIDPRMCTEDHVAALAEVGFNRASLGVQDVDPRVQRAIHRMQPFETTAEVAGWLRAAGFGSLNLDLIYGLPYQTPESYLATLDAIEELEPSRLAVYSYAHVPWVKPAQRLLERATLPDAEAKLALFKLVVETLTARGYRYIGLDHFAHPDDDLAKALDAGRLQRNFQGYSTHGGLDIYALGQSSISQIADLYVQHHKDLTTWRAAIDSGLRPVSRGLILSEDDVLRRHTIMTLMCRSGLDYAELSEEIGVDARRYFADEINALGPFEDDGLLLRHREGFDLSPAGRLLLRPIAQIFDTYAGQHRDRYAKAI